jgi:hypothetical protein
VRSSILLMGIYVNPTYTIDKALGIFLESVQSELCELIWAP